MKTGHLSCSHLSLLESLIGPIARLSLHIISCKYAFVNRSYIYRGSSRFNCEGQSESGGPGGRAP